MHDGNLMPLGTNVPPPASTAGAAVTAHDQRVSDELAKLTNLDERLYLARARLARAQRDVRDALHADRVAEFDRQFNTTAATLPHEETTP